MRVCIMYALILKRLYHYSLFLRRGMFLTRIFSLGDVKIRRIEFLLQQISRHTDFFGGSFPRNIEKYRCDFGAFALRLPRRL